MCDDATEGENEAYLRGKKLSRRELGVGAGATLALMVTDCAAPPAPAKDPESTSAAVPPPEPAAATAESTAPEPAALPAVAGRMVVIEMPEGSAEAFFVAPEGGPHPGVLMWPDIAGLRDAYKTMATRLAGEGYAVLVVNHYYRSTKLPVLTTFAEFQTEAGKERIRPLKEAITPERTASDGAAFARWLDQQKEVDKGRKLATSGYCMGGSYTFRTAAAVPERVGVIASFHGGGLVTDQPTSPHALLPKLKAAALICIAQNDDEREPTAKTTLRQTAEAAQIPAEVDVYPAQHGWCTVDSPVYDPAQAERAWAKMLATFQRYL